jgi:putative flippase GtrA
VTARVGGDEQRLILQRLFRFAAVGALGIVVQVVALALLVCLGAQYLAATGVAVEAAVLHNFVWHHRYTWRDRSSLGVKQIVMRMARFHLSNGLISIVGSLLLMRWLVAELGLGVIVANLVTIGACSVGNFLASDRRVFRLRAELAAEK